MTAAGDGDGHLIGVADPAGLVAGDRLGLLVAARLAARNGFGVRLDRSPAQAQPR